MCKVAKPPESFYWTSRRKGTRARHSRCIDCRRAQFNAWAKTPAGRARKRAGILRREFGLTPFEYAAMELAQGGCCAICGMAETKLHHTGTPLRLSIDHEHGSGRVRALLCSACNVGLGSFRDDSNLLTAAAIYLQKHRGKS
jgi:hypothetical protein